MTIYSQQQAATVCGVSVRTLQRRSDALRAAGAWSDATGQWHITPEALRAAGLTPGRPTRPDPTPPARTTRQRDTAAADARVTELEREIDEWRRRTEKDIAEWRRRAEVAEALAVERARTIDAQALALRALTAAPTPAPPPSHTPSPPQPTHHPLRSLLRHLHPALA